MLALAAHRRLKSASSRRGHADHCNVSVGTGLPGAGSLRLSLQREGR
jgi:hypothetical protein